MADNPDQPLITCDDKGQKFLLSNAVIEGTELKSASYGIPQNGTTYAVNLAFKGKAPEVFAKVSTQLARQRRHRSRSCSTAQVISTPASTSRSSTATPRSPATSRESEAKSLANQPEVRRAADHVRRDASSRDDRALAGRRPALGRHLPRASSACCW